MENPSGGEEGQGRRKIKSGDRISALPDGILHQILAFLPSMEESARTSILSKRWRQVWATYSAVHFFPTATISFVDSFLLRLGSILPEGEKLRSIHFPLPVEEEQVSAALHRWFSFAADREVKEMLLLIPPHCSESSSSRSVEIPNSLFECRSLHALKLQNCCFSDESVPHSDAYRYRDLKTLSLCSVGINDGDFCSLRWSCRALKTLILSRCRLLWDFVFLSHSLTDLIVHGCDELQMFKVDYAPSLRRLVYCGDLSVVWPLSYALSLEEVHLLSNDSRPFEDRSQWMKLISSLAHVKILAVNSWFMQFPLHEDLDLGGRPPLFPNLKALHWWAVVKKSPGAFWCDDVFLGAYTHALKSSIEDFPSLNQFSLHFNENMMDAQDYLSVLNAMSDSLGWRFTVHIRNQVHDMTHSLLEFNGYGYSFPQLKVISVINQIIGPADLDSEDEMVDSAPAPLNVTIIPSDHNLDSDNPRSTDDLDREAEEYPVGEKDEKGSQLS